MGVAWEKWSVYHIQYPPTVHRYWEEQEIDFECTVSIY